MDRRASPSEDLPRGRQTARRTSRRNLRVLMHQRAQAAFLVPRGLGALWIVFLIKTQVSRFLRIYYGNVNLSQVPADPAKLPRNQQPITPPESTQLSRSPPRRRRAWPQTQESLATRRLLTWLEEDGNARRAQLPISRPPTPPPEQSPTAQEFIDLSEDICRRFNHLPELQASVFGEVPNHWNISAYHWCNIPFTLSSLYNPSPAQSVCISSGHFPLSECLWHIEIS
jgi:hypothetical protein